jgi:hypothetical protein
MELLEWTMRPPAFALKQRARRREGAKLRGIRYERKVDAYMSAVEPGWMSGSWFIYRDAEGRARWAQPDGIIFDPWAGVATVVEVKLKHCSEAQEKLRAVYQPLVRKLMPGWQVPVLEICRWYDPDTRTKEPPRLVPSWKGLRGGLNVHILAL